MPTLDGFAKIGAALGGGNAVKQQAFRTRMGELAQEFMRAQAGRKYASEADLNNDRLAALTSGQLGDAFQSISGLSPRASAGAQLLLRATQDENMDRVIQSALRAKAAGISDPAAQNTILSAINGKPRDLTDIKGDTAFNPTMSPAEQAFRTTAIGQARIGAQNASAAAAFARAAASRASAGYSNARTNMVNDKIADPSRWRAPSDNSITPSKAEMEAVFPKISETDPVTHVTTSQVDPAFVRNYWMAHDQDPSLTPSAFVRQQRHDQIDAGQDALSAMQDAGMFGTQEAPYRPTTRAAVEAIPSGQWFVNPADNQLYRKK